MSKAVAHILSNDATMTAMLADGANSVNTLYNPQGDNQPVVVIMEDDSEGFASYANPSECDVVSFTVYGISTQQHTDASIEGAYNVVNQARKTLEAASSGTYNNETVSHIRKRGGIKSEYLDWVGSDAVACYQQFTMWRDVD